MHGSTICRKTLEMLRKGGTFLYKSLVICPQCVLAISKHRNT